MNSQSLLNSQNLMRMVGYESKQIFFKCSQLHLKNSYRNLEGLNFHDDTMPIFQKSTSCFLEDDSFCMGARYNCHHKVIRIYFRITTEAE